MVARFIPSHEVIRRQIQPCASNASLKHLPVVSYGVSIPENVGKIFELVSGLLCTVGLLITLRSSVLCRLVANALVT